MVQMFTMRYEYLSKLSKAINSEAINNSIIIINLSKYYMKLDLRY